MTDEEAIIRLSGRMKLYAEVGKNYEAEKIAIEAIKARKHGRWIVEANGMVTRCSECQSTITGLIFAKRWRYCHHCGAKMEVDDE